MKKKKTTRRPKRSVQKRKYHPAKQVMDLSLGPYGKNAGISTYNITDDSIPNKNIEALPKKDQEQVDILYEMTFSSPEKAIPRIEKFRFPLI